MSLLNWAWELPTAMEQDYATRAVGFAMTFASAQRMGESQSGYLRLGGAPVMLAAMRDMLAGLEKAVRS